MQVVIGRIERVGAVNAVHVSVLNVAALDGSTFNIPHMPFERAAFEASVDTLVAKGVAPDPQFEEGYGMWLSDRGGVFTIGVVDAVRAALSTMRP